MIRTAVRPTLALLFALSAGPVAASEPAIPYVVVLGIAQDAGYPHPGCRRDCCVKAWRDPALRRHVSSIAIVDPASGERWIVDAGPDLGASLERLNEITGAPRETAASPIAGHLRLAGILLTHAHIGHYTGLMFLGREGIGARGVPVWAMPRMKSFLETNGPWSQLVALENIALRSLQNGAAVRLNERITVTPLVVPHRDEFSETVGFVIAGTKTRVLFLPDIDKWEKWESDITSIVASVDRAYLDGTFFADGEVPGRSMKEIPHPFVRETMDRFAERPQGERAKIRFIHLNHSNPALDPKGRARREIEAAGFFIAGEGERFELR